MGNILWIIACLVALSDAQTQCEYPGTCHGVSLADTFANSTVACLEFCKSVPDCEWYTYYTENELCFAYPNCTEIDVPTCPTCITGTTNCPSYECFVQGKCSGSMLYAIITNIKQDCLRECQSQALCNWFSYNAGSGQCNLLEDCQLDTNMTDYVSGQRECELLHEIDNSKLFINRWNQTAWIDMPNTPNETNECSPVPSYPIEVWGASGAVVNGRITVCGGGYPYTQYCFSLMKTLNLWEEFPPLPQKRCVAASIMTRHGWWITGGFNGASYVSSSLLYNYTTGAWENGPDLPSNKARHCIARISDSFSFLAAGYAGNYPVDTWVYNWANDSWTEYPEMLGPQADVACKLYTDEEGKQHIIVAGEGTRASSFDLESLSWTQLPNLPTSANNCPTLVLDGRDLFLINPDGNNIMQFNEGNWTFTVMPGKTTGVAGNFSTVVPIDDFVLHGC